MGEKDGGRLILENLPRSHHRILFVKPPDLSLQLPKVSLQNQYGFLRILFIKVPDPLQDSLYKASRSSRPATKDQFPDQYVSLRILFIKLPDLRIQAQDLSLQNPCISLRILSIGRSLRILFIKPPDLRIQPPDPSLQNLLPRVGGSNLLRSPSTILQLSM